MESLLKSDMFQFGFRFNSSRVLLLYCWMLIKISYFQETFYWMLDQLCNVLLVIKRMASLLSFANCRPLGLLFDYFSAKFVHYEENPIGCFVVSCGDGSWMVLDGIFQYSDVLVVGDQPMIEPSRYSSPLLNLSMMKWKFLRLRNVFYNV